VQFAEWRGDLFHVKQLDGPIIVVLGTGTEIGKTHATEACLAALDSAPDHPLLQRTAAPVTAIGLKPIESGPANDGSDAARLARASRAPLSPMPYALPTPVSPHLAAELAGTSIQLRLVRAWVDEHAGSLRFVETAGAAFSPLNLQQTNADLARALDPDAVILVAPDRLGVLHDVRSTMCALRALAPGLPPASLCLMPAAPDESTGRNASELLRLGIAPRVVTFPRAEPTDASCQRAALALLDGIASDLLTPC